MSWPENLKKKCLLWRQETQNTQVASVLRIWTYYESAFLIKFLLEWYSYLFSLGWTSEDDSLVQLSLACILDLGVRVQLSQVNVVNEGDVVWGMPVKTVAVHVKWDLKYQKIIKEIKLLIAVLYSKISFLFLLNSIFADISLSMIITTENQN